MIVHRWSICLEWIAGTWLRSRPTGNDGWGRRRSRWKWSVIIGDMAVTLVTLRLSLVTLVTFIKPSSNHSWYSSNWMWSVTCVGQWTSFLCGKLQIFVHHTIKMKLEYKQKYHQASHWPPLDAGNVGEAGWRIELRPEATCEKLEEQPCRWNHLWLLKLFWN